MPTIAADPGTWTFGAAAVVALFSFLGIYVNNRGRRGDVKIASAAQTVEQKAKEFVIMSETLDAVVEDQRRQRNENERIRVALATCITDRKIARTNESRLVEWLRERHPGEPLPVLLDQNGADDAY